MKTRICGDKIVEDSSEARLQMVQHQLAARGIRNAALLAAMRNVPREFFVPPHLAEFAYLDTPLPIDGGQTISQP
jgi:protein-L-isoaspartate O-methyltransferase